MPSVAPAPPVFQERLTGPLAPDAYAIAAPLLLGGAFALAVGWRALGRARARAGRVRHRVLPQPDAARSRTAEREVVAPADGRVIALDEVELPGGEKGLRIGIFLSVFDVHVNRAPVAGRVVAIERSGNAFLAAFNPEAETKNVRLDLTLETGLGRARARGADHRPDRAAHRVPRAGRRVAAARRPLRADPLRLAHRRGAAGRAALARVAKGDRVRGGSSVLAELPAGAT